MPPSRISATEPGDLGYIAIYIEDMVSSCGPTFNVRAGCSIDLTGFMAKAALVGAAGANMKSSCLPKHG